MKIEYRNTMNDGSGRRYVLIRGFDDDLDVTEGDTRGGLLILTTDGGDIDIDRPQVEALIPVIQHWLEHGRLPEGKDAK